MDTRDINPNIIDVANETGFDDIMKLIGRYKKTIQPNYHHFVNEDLFQILTFDAGGVAGSGTPTLTVTITTTGFARRGNKLKFSNGKVGMINSAITTGSNKDSFTITSVDGTNLTAVAGDKVSVIGLVVGEKSGTVTSLNYGQTKYFNLIEALRDKTAITDVQKESTVEVSNGRYAYVQAVNQAQSFKQTISSTLIGGVKSVSEYGISANAVVDENGNTIQTTGGLDQEIGSYGVTDSVATPGVVLLSDIDDLQDQLIGVKAPSDYLLLCPDSAKRKFDTLYKNLGSSGITSARLMMDGKSIDYNVDNVTYGRMTYSYGELKILDHPQIFNFSGGPVISKTVYGMPKDRVKVQAPGGGASTQPRVGVRYQPNAGVTNGYGTEIIRETYLGNLASTPTSAEQVLECHVITFQGLECLGTRQMFKQRVLAD